VPSPSESYLAFAWFRPAAFACASNSFAFAVL
jgi:hypothetical protein